jgi:hypothetical protein
MDLLAALFGASIIAFSLLLVYRFGIKPEREAKKRQAELMHSQIRRRRREAVRNRARMNHPPTIKAS